MLPLDLFRAGRRGAATVSIIAIASTVACSDSATAPPPNQSKPATSALDPIFGKNSIVPPVVDGVLSPDEYKGAATLSFRVLLPPTVPGGATPATVYVTHDATYLYIATVFDRKSPFHPTDLVAFEFDNDNDGVREDGDDIVLTDANRPQNVALDGGDFYRFNGGAYNQSDPVLNATSAWGTVGTTGVFEIRHELNSTDDAHDFSIDPSNGAVTVGMITQVSLENDPVGSSVWTHTAVPSFTTYCHLTISKKATSPTC